MADRTNDPVPLTPLVVDVVTFDRAPLGRRGYHEDQVDEYLAFVGLGVGQRESDRQAVHGGDQMQP